MACIARIGRYGMVEIAHMLEIVYCAGRIDFKDNKAGRGKWTMIVRIVQMDMYDICM